VAARITAEKAGISWTSGAHTALPVLTTAQGVGGETFVGFFENTGIAARLKAFYP
jgi:alkaline phosphatase